MLEETLNKENTFFDPDRNDSELDKTFAKFLLDQFKQRKS